MRILTIVNLALWCVLFIAWVPYLLMLGMQDPVSTEVAWILFVTAMLQLVLGVVRLRARRPVLG